MTPEDRKLLLATARATHALLTQARLHESWVPDKLLTEIQASSRANCWTWRRWRSPASSIGWWFGEEMSAGPPPDDNEAQAMIALARMALEKRRR